MTTYEQAARLYASDGKSAVFDAVHIGILESDLWYWCDGCEDVTPWHDESCLVCGGLGDA